MSELSFKLFYERRLPHIQLPGSTLFITCRLANSLPKEIIKQLLEESREMESNLRKIHDKQERALKSDDYQRRLFGKYDLLLNEVTTGPHYLGEARIAAITNESLHYHDGKTYDLFAFCVMPNHVHMVVKPLKKDGDSFYSISEIMHTFKRYTARQSNILLSREGEFWQHESYDHVARDEPELLRIIRYVVENPVKAGFVNSWQDWQWTYYRYL